MISFLVAVRSGHDRGRKEHVISFICWSRETQEKVVDLGPSPTPRIQFHGFSSVVPSPSQKVGIVSSVLEILAQVVGSVDVKAERV